MIIDYERDAATMRTITLSLPSLLHMSTMRHWLVSQAFFRIDVFEPTIRLDRPGVEQVPLFI
jgi:hypothetical protein